MRAARWSDHDRYFGPFTFALGDYYRTFAVCLRSSDDEDRAATFRISIGRFSFLSVVPKWLIRPERKKVYPQWDEATVARLGRDWYWDITPREYSVGVSDGHLSIHYGRVTHDSSTEQRWGCFLPWTQWRHIRISFYGLAGERVGDVFDADQPRGFRHFDAQLAMEERVPKVAFEFLDFDGKRITASTHIEEREWRRGTGWFKWLSMVWPKKIHRSLDLRFSEEVGPEKGSWKGGTVGHSIEMQPGELHEAAFRRYCDQDHRSKSGKFRIKFVGPALIHDRRCQKCGQPTKSEEALVEGQSWCHPCADAVSLIHEGRDQ